MEADLKAKDVPEAERSRQLAELARQEEAQEKELDERFTQERDDAMVMEKKRQAMQLVDRASPVVEIARLKDQMEKDFGHLTSSLEEDKRRSKALLQATLEKRRKLRESQMRKTGTPEEDIRKALAVLDVEEERDMKELESLMEQLSANALIAEKRREALAEGREVDDQTLASLKGQHVKECAALESYLDAEKAVNKAKLQGRMEDRRKARQRELEQRGASQAQVNFIKI